MMKVLSDGLSGEDLPFADLHKAEREVVSLALHHGEFP